MSTAPSQIELLNWELFVWLFYSPTLSPLAFAGQIIFVLDLSFLYGTVSWPCVRTTKDHPHVLRTSSSEKNKLSMVGSLTFFGCPLRIQTLGL